MHKIKDIDTIQYLIFDYKLPISKTIQDFLDDPTCLTLFKDPNPITKEMLKDWFSKSQLMARINNNLEKKKVLNKHKNKI